MVRRKRIVVALAAIAAGTFSGAALAPAAGDRHATGASTAQRVSYTEDGIPFVDSGIECKAGKVGNKRHANANASDY